MEEKIRVGIVGYGNLGRGAVLAIRKTADLEPVAIFTRRDPKKVEMEAPGVPVLHVSEAEKYRDRIDVMLLCGGSAKDLPEQTPQFAAMFNTVDSFDTHAKIPAFFAKVDQTASAHQKTAIISVGWDPGLFSLNRLLADAILPDGVTYTFWGKGLSQGHSDAIRRVKGVKNGVQYTIPNEEAMAKVRRGEKPVLKTADKHRRVCYVVPEPGADLAAIEREIKTMPDYFADYDTEVHFISEEELKREHSKAPHGGFVIRSGTTGDRHQHLYEFSLKLDSNPEFTSSVLVAYARAAYRLNKEKQYGAKTVFDIPPRYISPRSDEELLRDFL
jgi:diaminopimelate dehydrogenase